MLQSIRDNVQGVIAKVIIAIIIVPFALFGVESLIGGGGATPALTINGEEVTQQTLQQTMELQRRQLLAQMGDQFRPELLDEAIIKKQAVQSLLNKRLLLQAADQSKVGLGSSAVDQAIVSMPQFQENGRFSTALFENLLLTNGYTPTQFKSLLGEDLVIQQMSSGIAGSDFSTAAEIERLVRIIGEKRSFSLVSLPLADELAKAEVNAEEIAHYYQENEKQFLREAQARIQYVELRRQDFYNEIDEQVLRETYEQEVAGATNQAERHAAHILLEIRDDRDEAQAREQMATIEAKLKDGAEFAALAAEFSEDLGSSKQEGDLGWTTGSSFPPEFEQALSALQAGQVSSVVKTDAGLHLIKLLEVRQQDVPSFEARRDAIKDQLQADQAEQPFVQALEELRDQVFNAADLDGPAKEMKLSVETSSWIPRSGGNEPAFVQNPQVLSAIFSQDVLEAGNNSEVIELSSDHYIVLRVAEHQPEAVRPLEEVSAQISEILQREKAGEVLQARADAMAKDVLAAAANAQSALAELAKAQGLGLQGETLVQRSSSSVEPTILNAIFTLPQPTEAPSVQTLTADNGDRVVVALTEVQPGSREALSDMEIRLLSQQLQRNSATFSFTGYMEALRASAEIEIF